MEYETQSSNRGTGTVLLQIIKKQLKIFELLE